MLIGKMRDFVCWCWSCIKEYLLRFNAFRKLFDFSDFLKRIFCLESSSCGEVKFDKIKFKVQRCSFLLDSSPWPFLVAIAIVYW